MPKINIAASLLALLGLAACMAPGPDSGSDATFRDCEHCPVMVTIPAGAYLMGTADDQRLIDPRTGKPPTNDGPQHNVTFAQSFAVGQHEVTVAQFARFIAATGHETVDRCMEFSKENSFSIREDIVWDAVGFEQLPAQPVVCVSYFDAKAYANWLATQSGKAYRLPTEAEWEYAARAGATTPYFWGDSAADGCTYANIRSVGADAISKRQATADEQGFPCDDGYAQSSPVGSFAPNAWGIYDMQGNAWEWVEDCSHKDYYGAPNDGSAWLEDDGKACRFGVIRGGSFLNLVERSSVTVRAGRPRSGGATNMGFRVALGGISVAEGAQQAWLPRQAGDNSAGGQLFADNCAACHLSSGDLEGLYGKSRAELISTITDGGNNSMSMPAFQGRLSETEIAQLADYLRQVNNWQ